ncbi:hypothetical protein NEIG_00862 [Nematocida sp. ERTm5]|nr:hypothetical protein NEIG_00862 [Nematocida sp. ERTm5]
MAEKKEEVIPNEVLQNTLNKLQIADAPSNNQILYIIKRANLSSTVVLAAISLLFTAREKLSAYIQKIRSTPISTKHRALALERATTLFNNMYILFSVCLVISSKYLIDRSYINRTWANILMINRHMLNSYEMCLLEALDYQVILTKVKLDSLLKKAEEPGLAKKEKKENRFVRNVKRIITCLFKNVG